jgi:hypothetical protein
MCDLLHARGGPPRLGRRDIRGRLFEPDVEDLALDTAAPETPTCGRREAIAPQFARPPAATSEARNAAPRVSSQSRGHQINRN